MAANNVSAMESPGEKGVESVNQRIESFDLMRGLAMMVTILFHSSIYNYPNVSNIIIGKSSFVVTLIGFVSLWGGILIILSMVINTIMLLRRYCDKYWFDHFLFLLIAGIIYFFCHYALIFFIGRWSNDFGNNQPNLTFIASSLRNLRFNLPPAEKLFDSSSMSAIAFNLIVMTVVLLIILRKFDKDNLPRMALFLGVLGLLILSISFIRVPLFSVFQQAKVSHNFLAGIPLGFAFSHPYPLLPYLSYGFFGSMIGMLIYFGNTRLLFKIVIPVGSIFIATGMIGMSQFERTIAKPDFYWYFKTIFELGAFLMMMALLPVINVNSGLVQKMASIKWFSRISLSIFLLETATSEIFRMGWSLIIPSWNQTILGCILFGCFNVIAWIGILYAWRKANFKFSFEYFWVKYFNRLGKNSTKMDFSANQP